jgi:hypothetical protein
MLGEPVRSVVVRTRESSLSSWKCRCAQAARDRGPTPARRGTVPPAVECVQKPRATDPFVAVQPDTTSWEVPALAIVEGTLLGIEPFATFAGSDGFISVPDIDGDGFHQENTIADPARSGLTQEQFDAVLLLGPESVLRTGKPYDSTQ